MKFHNRCYTTAYDLFFFINLIHNGSAQFYVWNMWVKSTERTFSHVLLRCQLFVAISPICSAVVTLMIQSAIDGKIGGNAALNNIEFMK